MAPLLPVDPAETERNIQCFGVGHGLERRRGLGDPQPKAGLRRMVSAESRAEGGAVGEENDRVIGRRSHVRSVEGSVARRRDVAAHCLGRSAATT